MINGLWAMLDKEKRFNYSRRSSFDFITATRLGFLPKNSLFTQHHPRYWLWLIKIQFRAPSQCLKEMKQISYCHTYQGGIMKILYTTCIQQEFSPQRPPFLVGKYPYHIICLLRNQIKYLVVAYNYSLWKNSSPHEIFSGDGCQPLP